MLRTRFTLSGLLAGSILVIAPKAVNPGATPWCHTLVSTIAGKRCSRRTVRRWRCRCPIRRAMY